jgi:lysyl-tRNA synthetase, class II
VEGFFDDIRAAWHNGIEAPGKELHMLVLVAFLASFGFIRSSAHMIRAEVSWWPGNVETKGGTHVHHLVWGILLLMTAGYLGVAVDLGSPANELVAAGFGIGLGLTLDEFALWLHLEDVYWSEKGRQSIDAVIVAATLLTIALLGLGFWIDVLQALLTSLGVGGRHLSGSESTAVLVPVQVAGACLAVVCFLKGKRFMGIVGLFVPLVALVGAARPAKSGSPWARRRAGALTETGSSGG